MHADKAKTPTPNICGALERSTPPSEAVQGHNALLENGVESVPINYLRKATRFAGCRGDRLHGPVAGWFERFMPSVSPALSADIRTILDSADILESAK